MLDSVLGQAGYGHDIELMRQVLPVRFRGAGADAEPAPYAFVGKPVCEQDQHFQFCLLYTSDAADE